MNATDHRASPVAVTPHLLALGTYAFLAVVLTWPLATSLTTGVIGAVGGVDAYQNAWNLWWVTRALVTLNDPFFSPLLFYPEGIDLFWQTLGFSQGVLALPVTLALGPVAAVNWIVLTSFIVGGYATFLLARRLAGNNAAALVAGATFVCSPYHMEKVIDGNLELAALHWIPWYAYALHLLMEQPSWRRVLLAGALLLWTSLGSWYYGLFGVLYTGCVAVIWAAGARLDAPGGDVRRSGVQFAWGIAPLLIWAAALAPRLGGLAAGTGDAIWDMRAVQVERSADLLDFFLPSPVHPWWGPLVRAWRDQAYPDAVIWNVALGWVALLLGITGAIVARRATWRWTLLLLACLVLALGPQLKVAGQDTGIPLPFTLLQDMPGIRSGQRPNHMAVMASLALAVLAAYGVGVLQQAIAHRGGDAREHRVARIHRLPSRVFARGAQWVAPAFLIAAIVALDAYAGQHTLVMRPAHPFYATLPPPDGAIMPLPLYININRSENLTAQTAHGWPIVGGYVARPPAYPFARYTPGVREIQSGEVERDDVIAPGWPELARQALAAYRIRYVTLDRASDKEEYFARVRPLLVELGVGPPVVADERLEAYLVPRTWSVAPLACLGDGWQAIERQPEAGARWRWMGERAEVRLYNPFTRPAPLRLTLSLGAYERMRPLTLALDGAEIGVFEVAPGRAPARALRLLLPPGEHELTLMAPATPDPARAGAPISVRLFALDVHAGASAP